MATFNPCIRSVRKDGFARVYIRISHNSAPDYIKTDFWVEAEKGVRENEIVDRYVLIETLILIKAYMKKLNGVIIKNWTVSQVKAFLLLDGSSISFTDFAKTYITREMLDKNREGAAANYTSAVNNLKKFYRKDNITFKDLTSKNIRLWIASIEHLKRGKSMYPQSIKTLFEAGLFEYNDYDNDVILISNDPFKAVKVPSQDRRRVERDIDKKTLRTILLSAEKISGEKAIMARDVAFIIFCLAGINTADLYLLEKNQLRKGKICYNRKKTRDERPDEAYFEIKVPEMILPLLEKHKGENRLFNFSDLYRNARVFNKVVNEGLKQVSEQLGLKDTTSYTFRKTWSTMAQNDCGFSTDLVGFCLNHVSAHRITEEYISKDFSPVDMVNKKVLDFVFNKGRRVARR